MEKTTIKDQNRKKHFIREITITVVLLVFFAIWLSPLLISLSASLRRPDNLSSYFKMFTEFSLESYKAAFKKMNYFRSLANSIIITFSSVAILVVVVCLAGYAIARIKNKVGSFLQIFFMAGMIVAAQMSIVPMYKILNAVGIANTKLAPILLYVTS